MGAVAPRTVSLAGRRYPLVLPSVRDPRLHLASVVVSIHVLGQLGLGFEVSVVQILAAVLTCAIIEVAWTFARTRSLVWPASAMLTGSSVALIFRVLGTQNGQYWSWRGWHLFAAVAGLSLVTKYAIRYRGSHVFNPSNVGLVVAFLALGSGRVEPLDFWWHPLDGWMAAAYLIILGGGLLITARLRLLAMSVAFWATLAAGIGVVSASGHCMTARWAFAPVCGSHFWWTIVTSPEVLIFLFFMITDPKTVPAGRVARMLFGASVAVVGTLLVAPQTTEFGAKVALLGSLVIVCAARPVFERLPSALDPAEDRLGRFLSRLTVGDGVAVAPRRAFARGAILGSTVVFGVTGIVAAGAPAREPPAMAPPGTGPVLTVEIDPSALPRLTVDAEVAMRSDLGDPGAAQEVAVTLAENLETEAQALLSGDEELLSLVDVGDRLREMQRRIDESVSTGLTVVTRYTFDTLRAASLIRPPGQGALRLGVQARGRQEQITYDGDGVEVGRVTSRVALTFVLTRPTGDRWLIVDTEPLG